MNEKIVELRNKLGVSRVAFAKDLGSSATQMKRMEIGTVIPDDEFIQKICSTYHVNPAYFTGEVDIDDAVSVVSPEEKKKQVGKRLKKMRIGKGLTLKELSALVGLSYSQLSLIENGEYMLNEKRAADISEVFHVGVEWLLYGDEEKKYFPLNEQMAQWLWNHPEIREQIWKMMGEEKKCMNKKIVELKNKLGLSRASFARALDISPSQMARIEAGKVVLSDEFLQKICSTFHVNPSFFTGEMDIDEAVKVVSLEEEMKQVGKRLKQARLEKGLTLKELSERVGLSDSQLCLIENGTNKLSEKRAVILGETLEVGVEWLLHGKERNKAFPADRKMMEWLKGHPEERERIWKMVEN